MKLIIAGGRYYQLTESNFQELDSLDKENSFTEIVSGGASGADKGGEAYAKYKGLPVKKFPADWKTLGKAAGPIRNRQMADYADAVVLFPGGDGTASMFREAKASGIKIWDLRNGITPQPKF